MDFDTFSPLPAVMDMFERNIKPTQTNSDGLDDLAHITDKLVKLWGTREGKEYIESLQLMELGREDRQGLPAMAFSDILLLEHIHDEVFPSFKRMFNPDDLWDAFK